MRRLFLTPLASCLALLASSSVAVCRGQQSDLMEAETGYIRVERNSKGEATQLQTSIVRYQSAAGAEGLTVDLIGAVHIGESGYYEQLNQQFKHYDAVLYELVAPKNTRPDARSPRDNPIAIIQGLARTLLNLDSQLECIDYHAPNFVHADMTPGQMVKSMEDRGESGLTVMLNVMADVLREANKQQRQTEPNGLNQLESLDPFAMLLATDRDVQLKRMMAEQFASVESLDVGLGPTLSQMLISDRNEAAMGVLRQQVAQGRNKIAIFYGAAHMSDFANRLEQEFGLQAAKTRWLTAWDLTSQAVSPTDPILELLKAATQGQFPADEEP